MHQGQIPKGIQQIGKLRAGQKQHSTDQSLI